MRKYFMVNDKNKTRAILLLLGVVFVLVYLGHAYAHHRAQLHGDNRLIEEMGTYHINDGKYLLTIRGDENWLVDYRVTDAAGKDIISPKGRFHRWQYWAFYWEQDRQRLWVDSHDIGSDVWIPGAQGSYECISVSEETVGLIKNIPDAFYKTEPEDFNKIFKR